ncbi:MAG: hypothetical protein A2845_00575 [Candidatus Lloydbacteria bacterium RIFCSPHIGHO2_01_FULL_49_22]|uniref:Uncharacterized protein n=1 Tax=Candidatus Lloydbacteria bacterium RIFCSPHIGHO2_01_FULL_49_22 TaxID=1798658 RepID=A0A1G2CY39_9BACT|nr:MAG: hypothetical protein A2845_00575 [Candidatus Lloydbacteria bacterium RIFCSPHIGHO2_01_FULL_49_22]OGZ09357.1 MAG: hypothetical protein A3C14_05480 [Candidatus Lloydbacteria bacterium RIFCSPHIGHO2_02_FULL_50_18]
MSKNSCVTVIYPKSIPVNNGAENCFLLGPCTNAPPYHEDVIDIFARLAREDKKMISLRINCPKREGEMVRALDVVAPPAEIHHTYARQREWEFETQESAAFSAGLLFCFVKQGNNAVPEKVYGAITQVEFGYWLARASVDRRIRIAYYSDGIYNHQLRVLLHDIERLAPWLLPMHTSFESLCAQSLAWAKQGPSK